MWLVIKIRAVFSISKNQNQLRPSRTSFPALNTVHVFASNSDWFIALFVFIPDWSEWLLKFLSLPHSIENHSNDNLMTNLTGLFDKAGTMSLETCL